MKASGLLRELASSGSGKAGLILLALLTLTAAVVVIRYPADYGTSRWGNPVIWADNPKSAPPAWANLLSSEKKAVQKEFLLTEAEEVSKSRRAVIRRFALELEHQADEAPGFLVFSLSDISFFLRPPVFTFRLERPDGTEITLMRKTVSGPRRGEEAPYVRHDEDALRLTVDSDQSLTDSVIRLYRQNYGTTPEREVIAADILTALFSKPAENSADAQSGEAAAAADGSSAAVTDSSAAAGADNTPKADITAAAEGSAEDSTFAGSAELAILKGTYRLSCEMMMNDERDSTASLRIVSGGSVYGIMGTDALGRDLAEGLLFGVPIALLIGISTATVSTFLGMSLGLVSGYFGGKTDIIIQRAADITANIPVLPLLIFLVFIAGSHLPLILLILVAFSWPGLTIMVRSMVLQLRTGQEVEASRALGAGSGRIIFRHVFPHTASYILAQLVFFAPSAILAEAGLSFLGLGDPSLPTWGQILENGFRTGAVFLGYWWWVIPPGLMIVITALTFMFLALGLEPVVDPRLRRRGSWQ